MELLNVGCGGHFHPSWTNIDIVSSSPEVIAVNVQKGLPFADRTFDAVYHSHLLEHLNRRDALALLKEALRVMKPQAIMRVVTPDLETIVRLYLDKLDGALINAPGAADDYQWMLLELLDQTLRNESGGEMGRYLKRPDLPNKAFILSRIGKEAEAFWNAGARKQTLLRTLASMKWSTLFSMLQNRIACLMAGVIAGRRGRSACQTGFFRESGEVHAWMYDRYSLQKILEDAGFSNIKLCRADESAIPDFNSYELDTSQGRIRKPDSLFVEGMKR